MARMRQVSQKSTYLSQAIPGYRGYSSSGTARKTDQVFSEEILSRLSETMATVERMKRQATGNLNPDALLALDSITETVKRLAGHVADTVPIDEILLSALENGKADEIVGLDSDILEKVGNINQALSVMDLEGGTGLTPDDLESVCELMDDLADCLRKRAFLIAG
jgi:hypothetical protein